MITAIGKTFVGTIAVQLFISCAMEEESSNDMQPIDWSAPQPIDSRDHSWDEEADMRGVSLSEEDVDQIERELRLKVPTFLRHWMTTNPFIGFLHEPDALALLRDYLIGYNVKLRREGYYGRKWPPNLLWIGSDGGFGAYYIESGEDKNMIHWYDWEQGAGNIVSPENSESQSPEKFIETMNEYFNDPEQ